MALREWAIDLQNARQIRAPHTTWTGAGIAICFFLITLAGAAGPFPFQDLFFMTIFLFGVCALLTYADK